MNSQVIEFENDKFVHILTQVKRIELDTVIEASLERVSISNGSTVIKPNLNKDLVALTGNSVELGILAKLCDALNGMNIKDITIAEGFNVGVDRRGIDGFGRLGLTALAKQKDVAIVDINQSSPMTVPFKNNRGKVSKEIADAHNLINVCKIKTHVEAGLSCALKNWVGINIGQAKRLVHEDLNENIVALNKAIVPKLIIVDGLIAMEGNGPGDGEPARLDCVIVGNDSFLVDLVVSKMIGLGWQNVPALVIAKEQGLITGDDIEKVRHVPLLERRLEPAPARTQLAVLSEHKRLKRLKKLVQPLLTEGPLLELAYKYKIVQDVYSMDDGHLESLELPFATVKRYSETLNQVCPVRWENIEKFSYVKTGNPKNNVMDVFDNPQCIRCLYCFWALPEGTVRLKGRLGYLVKHIQRYKRSVEKMFY